MAAVALMEQAGRILVTNTADAAPEQGLEHTPDIQPWATPQWSVGGGALDPVLYDEDDDDDEDELDDEDVFADDDDLGGGEDFEDEEDEDLATDDDELGDDDDSADEDEDEDF